MNLASAASPPLLAPATLDAAVRALHDHPDLTVLAGGTDVMVAVNDGRHAPAGWLSLHRIDELRAVDERGDGSTAIGAAVTMAELTAGFDERHPALAHAARTVGSAQIRAAATIGGNVMTASPAGDTLPVLVAVGAEVELVSVRGARTLAVTDFLLGPKRHAAQPDELLSAIHVPPRHERELFMKVGPRNAMVIAVCSLAACLDRDGRAGVAIGSVAPTVRASSRAAALLADPAATEAFVEAVVAESAPIDDLRSSARYRSHALGVLARRAHRRSHATAGG